MPGDPTCSSGLAFMHHNTMKVRDNPLANDIRAFTFVLQLVKLTSSSIFFAILNIYRPTSSSVAVFLNELTDTISNVCANDKLLLCSDLNCLGVDSSSINHGLAMVFDLFGLEQLVSGSTWHNNLLDVLETDDPLVVSEVNMNDARCLYDHRLICVKLIFGKSLPKPVELTP